MGEMGGFLHLLVSARLGVVVLALLVAGVAGCESCRHQTYSPACYAAPRECYPLVEKPAADSLASALALAGPAQPVCPHPLQVLAVSGGVAGAPYTAGVLVGWTQTGTRPTFDVVNGISSGALLGALAFLGPKYDAKLQKIMVTLHTSDLIRFRPLACLICDGAFGSAVPAKCLIKKVFDDEFMADLRQAHAEGRRYFAGTMNLKTKQLVIWDMGAIASSGRPDADELVRKVLLAAISWPGAFPPVEFEVEVDGHRYREQHCDAGPVGMAYVRFGAMPGWPQPGCPPRPGWLAGSNLYVLASRKLYSDPAPVSGCALPRLALSVSVLFEALTRADIAHLHSFCAASGMCFHLVALPADYHGKPPCFTMLFPDEGRQLFEAGYRMGTSGPCWRLTPPGAEPGEEAVPRDGREVTVCH
jgi:hypothetical protein